MSPKATYKWREELSAATPVIRRDDFERPEGADQSRSRLTSEVDREERGVVVLSEEEGDDGQFKELGRMQRPPHSPVAFFKRHGTTDSLLTLLTFTRPDCQDGVGGRAWNRGIFTALSVFRARLASAVSTRTPPVRYSVTLRSTGGT